MNFWAACFRFANSVVLVSKIVVVVAVVKLFMIAIIDLAMSVVSILALDDIIRRLFLSLFVCQTARIIIDIDVLNKIILVSKTKTKNLLSVITYFVGWDFKANLVRAFVVGIRYGVINIWIFLVIIAVTTRVFIVIFFFIWDFVVFILILISIIFKFIRALRAPCVQAYHLATTSLLVFVGARWNSPWSALEVATLDLLLVKLCVLELHVLVHGAFAAVRFVAPSNWALEMTLDLSGGPSMAFTLVVVRQVRFVVSTIWAIGVVLWMMVEFGLTWAVDVQSLAHWVDFFRISHRVYLTVTWLILRYHTIERLVKCSVLLIYGASDSTFTAMFAIAHLLQNLHVMIK